MRSHLPRVSLLSLLLSGCGSDPSMAESDRDASTAEVVAREVTSADAAAKAPVAVPDAGAGMSDRGAPSVNPPGRDAAVAHDAAAAAPADAAAAAHDAALARDAGSVGAPAADAGLDMDSLQQHCVDTINSYRATLSLPPYTRVAAKESCVDGEAASDGASGTAHGAFGTCKESAQDECPGWPSKDMRGQTDKCLAQMWAEGPGDFNMGHGHYINMSSTKYKSVACGFHDLGNGKFWATQDFF